MRHDITGIRLIVDASPCESKISPPRTLVKNPKSSSRTEGGFRTVKIHDLLGAEVGLWRPTLA